MRRIVLAVTALALISGPAALVSAPEPAFAQAGCRAQTPAPGTLQRASILNALRPHVEAMAGEDIEFVVQSMRVACTWARVIVRPQTPGGGGNRYESVDALLENRGGIWRLRQIACMEVGCDPAADQYAAIYPNLPRALLFL